MTNPKPSLLKASDITAISEFEFHHPLNSNSEVYLQSLSRATNLNRIAVTFARISADKESFIYYFPATKNG